MSTVVLIDCFSVGLDDLTRKQQAAPAIVLGIIKAAGRFSAFEASDNGVIARTVTDLLREGYCEDIGGEYPWTKVRITPKGEALLAGEDA